MSDITTNKDFTSSLDKLLSKADQHEKVASILKDKELVALMVQLATANDEVKKLVSARRGPYYTERYARTLIPVLDAMLEDGKDREFRYDQFQHYKKETLRLRLHQSFLYLIEHLDTPDNKYAKLRERIVITSERKGTGIAFRLQENIPADMMLHANIIDKPKGSLIWKKELIEWLESGEAGTKFEKDGLSLTEEEQAELEMLVGEETEDLQFLIKPNKVKFIRL